MNPQLQVSFITKQDLQQKLDDRGKEHPDALEFNRNGILAIRVPVNQGDKSRFRDFEEASHNVDGIQVFSADSHLIEITSRRDSNASTAYYAANEALIKALARDQLINNAKRDELLTKYREAASGGKGLAKGI